MSTSNNNSHHNNNVSQEYFDEICLENHVDFELSPDDAVQETIQQLESSSMGGKKLPSYLILNFPTSEQGIRERKFNERLKANIDVIRSQTNIKDDDANDGKMSLADAIQAILDTIKMHDDSSKNDDKRTIMITRFVLYGGFDACVQLWQNDSSWLQQLQDNGKDNNLYALLLEAFYAERATRRQGEGGAAPVSILNLSDLQQSFLRLWPTWLSTFQRETLTTTSECSRWNAQRINQLLQLAIFGTQYSEPNKKAFMSSKSVDLLKASPSILLEALDRLYLPEHHRLIGGPICRLIATLCTYDDFRTAQGGPTVSSAHSHVQTFHQYNAVVRVTRYLQEKIKMETSSAILSLRAMAIHDDIVQTMVATGALDTSTKLLGHLLSPDAVARGDYDNDPESTLIESLTAVVGLFRNVCANDEIKSKLCVGKKSIVRGLIVAMESYPDVAKLQEHACATIAAMALRSPRNADFLVNQCDVTIWIVRAMQKHPLRTTVQRQGALALRNLVSRSEDLRHRILQAGAAEVLKGIAARHVSCQDEVYAALRDLGLPVSMKRVEQGANGQVTIKETEMFGERNSGFRPVFD